MNLKIDKMDENHLKKISEELNEFDEFWNVEILKDEFSNENSSYFVGLDEKNEILGFAGLWFNIDEAHIMNIAVKKEYRRNYIGQQLLDFLISVAKNKNKECITLEVSEKNEAAYNLYKKMEFEEVGRRKKYYNNQFDAIIMTKKF